ncbi:MAG: hypothetical protein SVR04_10545 [Spirochaetota bacterium]|nr:hypothetical protein [Spirochaetota bacterium]
MKDGDEAMQVNWMELSILDKEGTIKKRFSFITDLPITDINITRMISYGRSRWKIENENNNILRGRRAHPCLDYTLKAYFGASRPALPL